MRVFLCVVLAVAAVSASLTTIGEVTESSFVSQHDDAILSFLQTAEKPAVVVGTGFERAMSVDEHFANTYGSVTLDGNSVFSKETVMGMVKDPQLLEALGYGDHDVFNGTELTAIVEFLQGGSSMTTRAAAPKMCYCHFLGGHDTDEDTEPLDTAESGDEDTSNPAIYAALLVGSNHQDGEGNDYNPGHQIYSITSNSKSFALGWTDYRICLPGSNLDDVSCLDTCIEAMNEGDVKNNGKFWGPEGCPYEGDIFLARSTVRSIQKTSYHLHSHTRELEELKMFSVLTRSNDEKRFCSEFSKRKTPQITIKSDKIGLERGTLLEDSCEMRVQRFTELADGDLHYVNSHVTSLNACEQDGACSERVGLRAMWPRLTGENCHQCMSRSYVAALDYEVLERNGVQTSTKSFCQLQHKIHPYLEEPMQDYECDALIQNFQSTGGATSAALKSCADVCDYVSPVAREVDGRKTHRVPLRQMDDSFWHGTKQF